MCKVCVAEGVLTGELERVILENTLPGHNKQYTLWIEVQENCTFNIMARYGPIGGWAKSVVKDSGITSMGNARYMLTSIANTKRKKGYVVRICDGVL